MVHLIKASTEFEYNEAKKLFIEYSELIGIDLSFQNFEEELKHIQQEYGAPEGCLLLAKDDNQFLGCVALRKIDDGICEMKRLFVKPEAKGKGIGKLLATSIIEEGKALGYRKMRLDTLPAMKPAISLYKSLGFYEIEPYTFNPIEGAIYMELDLLNTR